MKMASSSFCDALAAAAGTACRLLIPLACAGWLGVAAADGDSFCEQLNDGARGAESSVAIEHFVYRDKNIAVLRSGHGADETVRVCVDGQTWPSDLIARVGDGFTSRLLPFQPFLDVTDLIKALIDNDGVLFRI